MSMRVISTFTAPQYTYTIIHQPRSDCWPSLVAYVIYGSTAMVFHVLLACGFITIFLTSLHFKSMSGFSSILEHNNVSCRGCRAHYSCKNDLSGTSNLDTYNSITTTSKASIRTARSMQRITTMHRQMPGTYSVLVLTCRWQLGQQM